MDKIKKGFPQFSLKMRGTGAIQIIYEGRDLGVFDIAHLWTEYRKTREPNDPNRRYVIERAIETLEGKSPKIPVMDEGSDSGKWVDRWDALPRLQAPRDYPARGIIPPRKKRSKSLLIRILKRLWIL